MAKIKVSRPIKFAWDKAKILDLAIGETTIPDEYLTHWFIDALIKEGAITVIAYQPNKPEVSTRHINPEGGADKTPPANEVPEAPADETGEPPVDNETPETPEDEGAGDNPDEGFDIRKLSKEEQTACVAQATIEELRYIAGQIDIVYASNTGAKTLRTKIAQALELTLPEE